METLITASTIMSSSSSSPLSIFSPKRNLAIASRPRPPQFLPLASKNNNNEADFQSDSNDTNFVPLSLSPLSKDAAMGLVLSAATGRGWTTGSGMEGPSVPAGIVSQSGTERISTFPWSLFTKSPRRRMRVMFTCNICRQRTTRAINPHAYTDGTVFVQCCGCNAFHKLVDNLNLFHEMKCYVNPSFSYSDPSGDVSFKYLDMGDGDNDVFPIR